MGLFTSFRLPASIVAVVISLYSTTFSQPAWVHYADDGVGDMAMYDLAIVGNDLIVSVGEIITVITDQQTVSCNTSINPVFSGGVILDWIQPRSNGEIWCFRRHNDTYLFRFNGIAFQPLDTAAFSPFPPDIKATFETRAGILWACTADSGVFILNGTTWQSLAGSPKGNGAFYPNWEDKNGIIWGNIPNNGIYCYNPGTQAWTHLTTENSGLTTNRIRDIIEDKNGNIVVVADEIFSPDDEFTSGVFVYDGANWTKYDTTNTNMISSDALCVARDSTGNLWFGSRKGAIRWDGGSNWENMCGEVTPYKPCGFIRDIVVDPKNRVWIAGFHWGFFLLDPNQTCGSKIDVSKPDKTSAAEPGEYLDLIWDNQGPVGDVVIEYRNGLGAWTEIKTEVLNGKKYRWLIPQIATSSQYQIRISDMNNAAVTDTSERFTIGEGPVNNPPELTLADTLAVKAKASTQLTLTATDADSDPLTYAIGTHPSWVTLSGSTVTLAPDSLSTSFSLKVTVADGNGGTDTDSIFVKVTDADVPNRPPVFGALTDTVSVEEGATKSLTLTATDPDSDPLTYSLGTHPDWVGISGAAVTIAPETGSTSFPLNVYVADGNGGSDTATVYVKVVAAEKPNTAPVLAALPDTVQVKTGKRDSLILHATDADSDPLTFEGKDLPDWVSIQDSKVLFEAESASESFMLIVRVTDSRGGAATDSVMIMVEPSTVRSLRAGLHFRDGIGIRQTAFNINLIPAEKVEIHSALLYTLAGRVAGTFSRQSSNGTFTLKRQGTFSAVSIVRMDVTGASGKRRTVAQRVVW